MKWCSTHKTWRLSPEVQPEDRTNSRREGNGQSGEYGVTQMVKNMPSMWEIQVWYLGQEDSLDKVMATHSSILAYRIPWTEEPGGLLSMGSHRVEHDWRDLAAAAAAAGSSKKQESSRKTSISALLTMPKPLIVWMTINYGQFWKRWEYQTTWPASWETYMLVRKQ